MNNTNILISADEKKDSLIIKAENIPMIRQFDNKADFFTFIRPSNFENYNLVILLEDDNNSFEPQHLNSKNILEITSALTQQSSFTVQIFLELDKMKWHSNKLAFQVRTSINYGDKNIEPLPAGYKPPIILENNNWGLWDIDTGEYVDTNYKAQGLPGAKGDTGVQGLPGDKGDTGAQGVPGIKGDTGAQGVPGDKGDTGEQGLPGIKGDTGAQGVPGDKGDIGEQGLPGAKGDTGVQGLPGDKGDNGISAYDETSMIFSNNYAIIGASLAPFSLSASNGVIKKTVTVSHMFSINGKMNIANIHLTATDLSNMSAVIEVVVSQLRVAANAVTFYISTNYEGKASISGNVVAQGYLN